MNMKSYVKQAAIPATELLQIELYYIVQWKLPPTIID